MNVAYLCLGGNIGDRENALNQAIIEIEKVAGNITAKSSIYETEAWGVQNQQAYYNQCIKVNTSLNSLELIEVLLLVEKNLGRKRDPTLTGYQARTMDIDILFFNNDVVNISNLIIPHPRLHLRKFVLTPLNEIASNYLHPLLNKSIFSLLTNCNDSLEVKKITKT